MRAGGPGTEAPLLEAHRGRRELEAEAGGELALGCGAAVPRPPRVLSGIAASLSPRRAGGATGAGEQRVFPTGPTEGWGRKVTDCSGISSLAVAELAAKTLHKKRLQSMESGGRARSALQPAA